MAVDAAEPSVGRLLARSTVSLDTAGVDSGRLDAELLLADAFGFDRARLLARLREPVPADVARRYDDLLARRLRREPTAYIRGHKEFMSIEFEVSPAVMIPRPDTETLVELGLDLLEQLGGGEMVMDLGTGSGCIGVSLAAYARKCVVYASDISRDAVEVARRNAAQVDVEDRMVFAEGDLYEAFEGQGMAGRFDLIVSNPPYVSGTEWRGLAPEAAGYEPCSALVAGEDGFEIVRRLVEDAPQWLRVGGTLLVETPADMAARAGRLAEATGLMEEVGDIRTIDGRVCGIKLRRTL